MRIISGSAGRRRIAVPGSVARPSTDRLREALFSILANRIRGARVLDLFSGSGALGLEALSRGAASAVMVDSSRDAHRVIGKNLRALGLNGGRAVQADVFRFLDRDHASYDVVFADPPYFRQPGGHDFVAELLAHANLAGRIADGGLLVIEDPPENKRAEAAGWSLIDERKYGGCGILFYQPAEGH